MDTLFSLKVFCEVVRQGSFTRAADKLGISTAMASKHVSHLERQVRAKLLQRNSRNLHLTEAGEDYYRQCGYALETLAAAAERASGGTEKPQGLLRITMPMWFATHRFGHWLAEYRRRCPEVDLDLLLDNRKVDLVAEGVDLALRVTPNGLPPSLVARPLCDIEFFLAAAPDYLAQFGTPKNVHEANRHAFVLQSYNDMANLTVFDGEGRPFVLSAVSHIRADNTLMVRRLVLAGCGIGYLPEWALAHDLETGRLVRVLPDYAILSAKLYAVYADRAFLSAKIRSFIDFLCEKTAAA
ncbi:MAG: LysR family transcriptional regulator [Neisseria sp.]|nr:LysR family transcriptional regulator [Neisseria sp.]